MKAAGEAVSREAGAPRLSRQREQHVQGPEEPPKASGRGPWLRCRPVQGKAGPGCFRHRSCLSSRWWVGSQLTSPLAATCTPCSAPTPRPRSPGSAHPRAPCSGCWGMTSARAAPFRHRVQSSRAAGSPGSARAAAKEEAEPFGPGSAVPEAALGWALARLNTFPLSGRSCHMELRTPRVSHRKPQGQRPQGDPWPGLGSGMLPRGGDSRARPARLRGG